MTTIAIAMARITILITTILITVAYGYYIATGLVILWFLVRTARDEHKASHKGVQSRIQKLREDKRRYPYKYRLNNSQYID